MHPVVAIDGPSGAGKGTVARAVARALDWPYVDTGAMYRAVAWGPVTPACRSRSGTEDRVAALAANAAIEVGAERVAIDGHDVTGAIRTPEITIGRPRGAPAAGARGARGAPAAVRAAAPVVMEGRDIGTVVFPEAAVKVYLDASPDARPRAGLAIRPTPVEGGYDRCRCRRACGAGPSRPHAPRVAAAHGAGRHRGRYDQAADRVRRGPRAEIVRACLGRG